jgi:hypothetical protein
MDTSHLNNAEQPDLSESEERYRDAIYANVPKKRYAPVNYNFSSRKNSKQSDNLPAVSHTTSTTC